VTLRAKQQRVDDLEARIRRALRQAMTEIATRVKLVERGLISLSPLATLDRGYAIVTRQTDGDLVTSSRAVSEGSQIDIRLAAGELAATVNSTKGGKRG
jgi:exodeoxyribonuclease VII large subunit